MNFFSVIICNYNYEIYIGQAIESVLSQSYEDFELIIVDDGSTDGSRKIIDEFEDPRIIRVFQENQGQAAAFNSGYEKSTSDFVAFLDSDDCWFPDKIKKCLEAFDDADVCAVQHNLSVVDATSNIIGTSHPGIKPGERDVLKAYFDENHTGFFSATSGVVCRSDVLDQIFPLDGSWKICADVAFTRPLPIFGKIVTLTEDLGAYRIHGDNNWMHTEEQQNWLENQQGYVDYTNDWLSRCGVDKMIDFEKSNIYRKHNKNKSWKRRCFSLLKSKLRFY